MNDRSPVAMGRAALLGRNGARMLLFVAMAFVWFAVLLPNTGLRELRRQWQPLSQAISWVERIYPPVDMVHVVLFSALGLLLALAFPAIRRGVQFWAIVALSAATELAQLGVAGRSAKVTDFAMDIVGGVLGLTLGWCVLLVLAALGGRK